PNSEKQPKAISLGVSESSPWDLEMANMGYLVLQYDASIDQGPYVHPNILFHKKFVGTQSDQQTTTLEQIMQDHSFDPSLHNILQIDIEGAEWDIFEKLDFSILEKYFAQIIIEFHWCDPRKLKQTQQHLAILEKFHQAFQPIHLHYNNCCTHFFYIQERFFCNVFEVSYLRQDLVPPNLPLRETCGDIAGLDYPNDERLPDVPIRFALD
ncbi:FkbM family methyltransferase, partial [Helicobacter bizzozeronii]|uniref:FkbM family methyltransferase n=1 Tax=Helicobacter bizzozeronii TaxID=56877 RepID=UPI002D78A4A7